MIEFNIVSFESAGPVRFGVSPKEVEKILGPADSVSMDDGRQEWRGGMNVQYSETDGGVEQMGFLPAMNVTYRNRALFQAADTLEFLAALDTPYDALGIIVFLKLGLTLGGFHDHDESQKSVTVFRQGVWDFFLSKLKPLELS